jgi:DNA-binding CsgD family transcriptional regulator
MGETRSRIPHEAGIDHFDQGCRMPLSGRVLARIQRLCCLGIGGEMLVPELIREVTEVVPSRHTVFYWLGPNLESTNTYATIPSAVMNLFFKEYYLTDRQTAVLKTPGRVKCWPPADRVLRLEQKLLVDRPTFLRSAFYNDLWRVAEIHETLTLVVRSAGRIYGTLDVCRGTGEPPFGPSDIKKLDAIAGFVAHGVTRVKLEEDALADSDDRALFLADSVGKVRHAEGPARHLLTMALNPHFSPMAKWRGLGEPVPEIERLCRALATIANGDIGQPPPVLRLRNPWGEFVLRAYWFGATDGAEPTRLIGITVERRVPRALALRRRVEDLPLTAREKQLCLLLARNLSSQDLADAMGVAASTVITHQRSVYAKLGVHSRAGLLTALEEGRGWSTRSGRP